MDALIKISASEFNEEVFKRIKALLKSAGNAEVTIAISNKADAGSRKESSEEYWQRLNKSIQDIEAGNGIVFTMDELNTYIHKMP